MPAPSLSPPPKGLPEGREVPPEDAARSQAMVAFAFPEAGPERVAQALVVGVGAQAAQDLHLTFRVCVRVRV